MASGRAAILPVSLVVLAWWDDDQPAWVTAPDQPFSIVGELDHEVVVG